MNIKHILPILATVCLSCTSGARPPESGEHGGSLTLIRLKRSVAELVGRHYPGATTHTFGDKIRFERSTRVFVSEAIVKLPKGKRPPLEEVRGPVEGGVWGELRHVEGAMHERPPYPRAEGAIQRRGFVEHTFYQDYASQPHGAPACHLVVTLRLPGDTTEKEKKFIKDLRGLLSSFNWQGPQTAVHDGARIDPSTSGPVHPNTREAATKALEKLGGNAPEGLRVHPAAPQKDTKVDPTTSGPVHPNTREAATKALEKLGGKAPEGLRVHPADPQKGAKVDPSTSGPIHPNTEEAAKKALEAIGGKAPEGLRVHPADPQKGAKVDPSTSGPIHPNTEEAAKKALEAIGGNAPEGLRVHPADPQKGAKVDPSTSGPIHPNTEEAAKKALSQQPLSKGTWSYKNGKPESVTFDYGTELTAEDIDRLSGFGSIARINMGYAGIDSEYVTIEGELLKLGQLKNLRELHLCKDGIYDDDLRFVALLPKIHTLEFNADNGSDDTPICTDGCADHLSAAKTLRKLVIHDGQFTDKFVATITKQLSGLEELWLNSPDLTDESLRLLADRCEKLKTLRIASDHFTAEGLKHLDQLKHLEKRLVTSPALRKERRELQRSRADSR